MGKFTLEEVNLVCVFKTAVRTELIRDINQVFPHLKGDEGTCRAGFKKTRAYEKWGRC